jgi:histone-lysine N-methyltransferase SETMAR
VQLKDIWKEKRCGNFTKDVLYLRENTTAQWELSTQKKLAHVGFKCLEHPPYSPDQVPSDYDLFPGLKKQLKNRHFSSDAQVIAAEETWFHRHFNFFEWLAKDRGTG